MKDSFIYTALLLVTSLGFISCDSTTSPEDIFQDKPAITNFTITPQNVQFTSASDGVKDTTVQVTFTVEALNLGDENPLLTVTNRFSGETELEESLTATANENEYRLQIPFETRTTFFEEFKVNVLVQDQSGNFNYAEGSLNLLGFSEVAPEILETDSPGVISRPESGSTPATFTAKVTDVEGQSTIDKVYLRVINQESGEVQGSPFEMFDDGSTFNDGVAGDSTYTWSLPVEPTENNPNRDFDIEFLAIDKAGLTSDTVKTTFSIVE